MGGKNRPGKYVVLVVVTNFLSKMDVGFTDKACVLEGTILDPSRAFPKFSSI